MKKYAESLLIIVLVVFALIFIYFSWQLQNANAENKRLTELMRKEKKLESLLASDNERMASTIELCGKKGCIKAQKRRVLMATKAKEKTAGKQVTGNRGYLRKNGVFTVAY